MQANGRHRHQTSNVDTYAPPLFLCLTGARASVLQLQAATVPFQETQKMGFKLLTKLLLTQPGHKLAMLAETCLLRLMPQASMFAMSLLRDASVSSLQDHTVHHRKTAAL